MNNAPPISLGNPSIEGLLSRISGIQDAFQRLSHLRDALDPDDARRAALLLELRERARTRYGETRLRHLTRRGLEQASRPEVAAWRARRIADALGRGPGGRAFDLTAGLGSDALALAAEGCSVFVGDLDPVHLRCATAHLEEAAAEGLGVRAWGGGVIDAARPPWAPEAVEGAAVVLDPDRRATAASAGGRDHDGSPRALDPALWSPSLGDALAALEPAAVGCIKAAPSTPPAALGLEAGRRSASWVSFRGELMEISLWTGAGATREPREAVVLRSEGEPVQFSGEPTPAHPRPIGDRATRADPPFVLEVDVAVRVAGLAGALTNERGPWALSPDAGYLAGNTLGPAGLTRSFRVLGAAPVDPRRVRELLAAHDVGPVTIKKRGHPKSSDALARQLLGAGRRSGRRGTLIVSELAGEAGRSGRSFRAYLVEEVR